MQKFTKGLRAIRGRGAMAALAVLALSGGAAACSSTSDTARMKPSADQSAAMSVGVSSASTTDTVVIDPAIQAELDRLQKEIDGLDTRVTNVEDALAKLSDDVKAIDKIARDAQKTADAAMTKSEVEDLIDKAVVDAVASGGYVTEDQVKEIVAQLTAAGVDPSTTAAVEQKLMPTVGPNPGEAGPNACLNRGSTNNNQLLTDVGSLLKWMDTARPSGVPSDRQSFATWELPELQDANNPDDPHYKALQQVADLWNARVGVEAFRSVLQEDAPAGVYWCAGIEEDGVTVRSGLYSSNMKLRAGKAYFDLGNGVGILEDCHNLQFFLTPPEQPPVTPPGATTTTVDNGKPPVTTVAAPATTAASSDSTPPATSPSTIPTPPQVTNPRPVDTIVDGTVPAGNPTHCIPGLPVGNRQHCP